MAPMKTSSLDFISGACLGTLVGCLGTRSLAYAFTRLVPTYAVDLMNYGGECRIRTYDLRIMIPSL